MFSVSKSRLNLIRFGLTLLGVLLIGGGAAVAQETGGDLVGGAGIFRAKNPEAKRSHNPRPTRPRLTPEEIEEKFQDAISDGNDARDARDFPAAEKAYRAALALKPRDTRAFQGLGNVLADLQRWDEAEAAYRKAVEFAATNPDAMLALSFVLVQPRSGAMNARRFSDAEYYARRATQLQPTNAMAFDRLGAALIARGIFNADTEAALRKAVELDPNYLVAQVRLARVLRRMNHWDQAEPIYKAAIEKAQDAPTLVLIAEAIQSEQRWSDSEPVLTRALKLDPRNPGALYLMGRFLSVRGRYEEAEPVLRQAVEVNPKSFQARTVLGRSYLGLERYDEAFKTYDQAVDLASEANKKDLAGAFGFTGIGDGYLKAGRVKDALRAYERGLEVDPTNAELPAKIAAARAKLTS
jgi:tetratricopeptide (TPR) repeat protein